MKLKIKGKEYGMHFGIGATEIASGVFEKDEDDIFFNSVLINMETKEQIGVSRELVFGAIVNWCEENDVEVEFSFRNFLNAFNEISPEVHKEILSAYKKAYHNGRVVEEIFAELLAAFEKDGNEEEKPKKKPARSRKSSKTASDGADLTIVK